MELFINCLIYLAIGLCVLIVLLSIFEIVYSVLNKDWYTVRLTLSLLIVPMVLIFAGIVLLNDLIIFQNTTYQYEAVLRDGKIKEAIDCYEKDKEIKICEFDYGKQVVEEFWKIKE